MWITAHTGRAESQRHSGGWVAGGVRPAGSANPPGYPERGGKPARVSRVRGRVSGQGARGPGGQGARGPGGQGANYQDVT